MKAILLLTFVALVSATTVTVISPISLYAQFKYQSIPMHVTPIGFRPLSGRLEGKVVLANPSGACSMIDDVHDLQDDIFILADDSECLESVKAKNIANSGGYVGIIKQNIANTLHDKEINLVHIPIVELEPDVFDHITTYIKQHENETVTLSLDFTDRSLTHRVNFELWFSPTETASYSFLLELKDFLTSQPESVKFTPHYVLQSQRDAKIYLGCFSSGKYCPTEIEFQGKPEGANIVEESLRQIIIWKISKDNWWIYLSNFYTNCILQYPQIFTNSTQLFFCSENSMIMSGVDLKRYKDQYNNSFLGSQREVADNTYLLEERQHYIKEQISSHPIGLINKKPISLNARMVEEKVCKLQGEQQSGPCKSKHRLSSIQMLIIVVVLFVIFVAVAAIYRLYIYIRMRREIKGEVDKTLEQYYRYIETFQGADGEISPRRSKPTKEKSRQLGEDLQEIEEKRAIEMEMGEVNNK